MLLLHLSPRRAPLLRSALVSSLTSSSYFVSLGAIQTTTTTKIAALLLLKLLLLRVLFDGPSIAKSSHGALLKLERNRLVRRLK